jgi:hypothetical protein
VAKKEESQESYDFVPPDFDEDAFIHKEMVEFKTTIIRTVVALVAAIASWGVFVAMDGNAKSAWPATLAICIGFGLLLKPIFARFADITVYKRMDWVGTAFVFFLTWLAFFTLAVNPPIGDFSPPQVFASADPPVQTTDGAIRITYLASDNAGTPQHTLRLTRDGVEVPAPQISTDPSHPGRHTALFGAPDAVPGRYSLEVRATDGRGHTTAATANFTIREGSILTVRTPAENRLAEGTEVLVLVDANACSVAAPPCLRTVYFRPLSGGESVPFEYNEGKGGWFATSRFAKWQEGNNTGRIAAEFIDHHQGTVRIQGGPPVETAQVYTFQVSPPPGERYTVTVMPQPPDMPLMAPGYGLLGAVAALLGVALVLRRRQPE